MSQKPKFERWSTRSADGTTIAIDSLGTGPGLVLLSGSVVPPSAYEAFARSLSSHFAVHVVHRRGRGRSGPQGAGYSMTRETEDVQAVLEKSGSTRLFGHSFGGSIALETARTAAGSGLTAVSAYEPASAVDGLLPGAFAPEFRWLVDARQYARALTVLTRTLDVGGLVDRLPFPLGILMSWIMLATIGRDMRKNLHTVPNEIAEGLKQDGPGDRFNAITIPTLLVVGENGPDYLQHISQAIVRRVPGSLFEVVKGMDHNGPLLKPLPVAERLKTFFGA